MFVRYNYQREIQQFPVGLWWRNGDQVPYPSPHSGQEQVGLLDGNRDPRIQPDDDERNRRRLHFHRLPQRIRRSPKVDRTKVGYGYAGLFNNGVKQIPSFGQFGPSEAALVFNPGGFEAGGPSARAVRE